MRNRHLFPALLLVLIFLILGSQAALTQNDDAACEALIQQVFTSLSETCSGLEANSVCYGSGSVEATFAGDSVLSQPADRQPLTELQTLHTGQFDSTASEWGAAVLNVQANVPSAAVGPAVTLILLGDVEVENAVAPEEARQSAEPIEVITLLAANLRSGPSTNAQVITSVKSGTSLMADGFSGDTAWLRVLHEGVIAWVSRDLVAANGPLDSLPVISADSLTSMQKFYLRNGASAAGCANPVPPLLLVQGPQNLMVSLNVNDVEIRLSSTMALHITEDNKLQVIVLNGSAYIGNLTLPAGFTISAPLSPDGRSIAGDWENFRPLTADELAQMAFLGNLTTGDFLHYAVTVPTLQEIQTTLAALRGGSSGGGGVVGAGSSGPAAGNVNCDRFNPTSPLGGMVFGPTTFYWDAAPGATNYQLNVYSDSEQLLGSFNTNSANPAVSIDTSIGAIGQAPGSNFAWDVSAIFNGQLACTSSRVSVVRDAFPVVVGGGDGSALPTPTPPGWSG